MTSIDKQIEDYGIVPVAVINDAKDALPLADAVSRGGLPCLEVTFRTAAAEESIRRIVRERPNILVGAGTVITMDYAQRAVAAGAKFIVAPGFDAEVVDYCIEQGVPVYPGCSSASEVTWAYKRGLRVVKFFPCGTLGGLPAIHALAAPFVGMRFMPTGGISASNVSDYLTDPRVIACGGTWMAKADDIAEGSFDAITAKVAEAVSIVKAARA